MRSPILYIIFCLLTFQLCANNNKSKITKTMDNLNKYDTATFGAGCFWCVEAIYQQLEGVISVTSGYAGGKVKNPSYQEVCTGETGHAEICQIVFDPAKISFSDLLEVFWTIHDPTSLNKQGADHGTQYRSVIFYHDEQQHKTAVNSRQKLDDSGVYPNKIVTEISKFKEFYKAENYHQDYYNQNSSQSYCTYVIQPKLNKFKKTFQNKMKK